MMRKGTSAEIIDLAINDTLSRTLMTSFTTLIAVFSLLLIAGDVLRGFSVALAIGVFVGTYSSSSWRVRSRSTSSSLRAT